jgi:hypothetical protein
VDREGEELDASFPRRYVEALRNRNVNPRCDVCGHEAWQALASLVGLPLLEAGGETTGEGRRMLALACTNCATVRLIAPELVAPPTGGARSQGAT